jgi:endoglucanase
VSRPRRLRRILAVPLTVALVAAGLVATAGPARAEPTQHISNGTFDTGTSPWWNSGTPISTVDGQLCAEVPAGTVNPWDASFGYSGVPLIDNASYALTFTASATVPVTVKANVQLNEDPFTTVLGRDVAVTPTAETRTYSFTGSLQNPNGVLTFQLGGSPTAFTFCLDNVSLTSEGGGTDPGGAPEQLENGNFDNGSAGWFAYGASSSGITDGRFCATLPTGLVNPWDAGIGQNDVPLVAGAEYTYTFEASADPPTRVNTMVQLGADPFTSSFFQTIDLTPTPQTFTFTFTGASDSAQGQVVFHLGANAAVYNFCVDNASLRGGEPEEPYVPDTGPRVRVNQVGYLPSGPKNATIVTESTDPVGWELRNGSGSVVAQGNATPRGVDTASGQNVQTVDFSSVTTTGSGFTLVADGETSHPFDIRADLYNQLRSDALQFFYIQRSGIAIDGALVGQQYARPAGHVGVAPNQGDLSVPCQPGVCGYRLDVRGGWYDAGDHGKYVVNGGIAAYQVMSTFERTKSAVTARFGAALGDSTLRVPERGNRVPDVLDEARWELEFLMRMQVPDGEPLAGMAHHKMHDRNWTGLPMQPEADPELRELHPPSTAATLNLAAAAAQCARLYVSYDAAFATRCLTAARKAWVAAKANPARLADPNDGNGGGSYSDGDVSDEFYWAAAELYLTTGEAGFLAELTASPHHTGEVFSTTGFNWPATAALGRLDLATVPSGLSTAERTRIRQSVVEAADRYLATLRAQAYGLPLPGGPGNYFWGSNSNILNNAIVIATAFDLTGDAKYRNGAVESMDYLLGRNALNHSYVTGWGEKSSRNQHSRIFGNQIDQTLPIPPAGSLSGGANASLDDPFAAQLLRGCKPQFCFVDDIASYSTNEVAVNWNSGLSWMASFVADQGATMAGPTPPPVAPLSCRARYTNYGTWQGGTGFTGQVDITNTGVAPIDGWTIRWAFATDPKVREGWLGRLTQDGATVTAVNESYNRRIAPGGSILVGFNAVTPLRLANPAPALITVNGVACG